ncbi:hypothetical protein [Corynebacterium aquilae]|uniref:Uncharacterized protein n=1 Tax=Corynebacterium aquilae DSM 44791 TaxID=1431546 RepID=A0A1L7CI80_9CORY|nr:hypothetical protein [Corynebacterium aquilae]APT85561.1 hypothetical protein CAQU_11480 [Corynebacterium aquilae DSM 44791]
MTGELSQRVFPISLALLPLGAIAISLAVAIHIAVGIVVTVLCCAGFSFLHLRQERYPLRTAHFIAGISLFVVICAMSAAAIVWRSAGEGCYGIPAVV